MVAALSSFKFIDIDQDSRRCSRSDSFSPCMSPVLEGEGDAFFIS